MIRLKPSVTEARSLSAVWLNDPAVRTVLDVLGHDSVRLVGGCVRDGLLGAAVSDIDMAAVHLPEVTTKLAVAAGMKVIPTGIDHGTVTVINGGRPFEVTTLREDLETDGRHAVVAFTDNWEADASRRDFTINALYADASGRVYDYFGGLEDLEARQVRFIGDAGERITEDALRILRFYRFSARFADALNGEGRAACKHWSGALKSLSRERIHAEWFKLLQTQNPAPTVLAMHTDGVLGAFLPEADAGALDALVSAERCFDIAPAPLRRFAALLPADAKVAEAAARRLKCSNAERLGLAQRALRIDEGANLKALLYRHGEDLALDLALISQLTRETIETLIDTARTWHVPSFPIGGQDLMSQTALRGPDLGRALYLLEEAWIESGFMLSADEIIARAKTL